MLIELHEARVDEKPVMRHLMELYQYDLSETEHTDVGPDGRFGYPYLDDYWFDAGRHPFLIRVDGQIAGFVLVRRLGEEQGELLYQVAEFFIMRKYRRRGAGRSIARRVFDAFPGIWTVQQREENALAQAFWRRVITEYTGGRFEESRLRSADWRGPVQRFHSRRTR